MNGSLLLPARNKEDHLSLQVLIVYGLSPILHLDLMEDLYRMICSIQSTESEQEVSIKKLRLQIAAQAEENSSLRLSLQAVNEVNHDLREKLSEAEKSLRSGEISLQMEDVSTAADEELWSRIDEICDTASAHVASRFAQTMETVHSPPPNRSVLSMCPEKCFSTIGVHGTSSRTRKTKFSITFS